MPAKLVPLSSKSTNSATWSPEQALEEFLADLRAGKVAPVKMILLFFEEGERKHALHPHCWYVNINPCEEVALLAMAQHRAIEDWKA